MEKIKNNTIPKLSTEADIKPSSPICNFWMRLLAMCIDSILLSIAGSILGLLLRNLLIRMCGWELLIGFTIVLVYFGILNSRLGNGQSLGKKLTQIRVVGRNGECISFRKSLLRTTVFTLPFFLNGAMIPQFILMSPIGIIVYLVLFGGIAGIIYFYTFNRGTRQSLHDLICKTYVVRARASSPITPRSVARVHYIVFALIIVCILIYSLFMVPWLKLKGEFPELFILQEKLNEMENVSYVGVFVGETLGQDGGSKFMRAQVFWKRKPIAIEDAIKEVAKVILNNYEEVDNKDNVGVTVIFGFDIGLARYHWFKTEWSSPDEWREQLNEQKWQEFTSQEGRFSVLMVGTVNESIYEDKAKSLNGPSEFHAFSADNMNIDFLVAYRDYPDWYIQRINPDSLLEQVKNGIVVGFKGNIIFEEIVYLEEFRGKKIMAMSQDRKTTMQSKIFLVENRVYLLFTEFPEGNEYSKDVEKFMNSFKIIEK
ncbi:RDD family protein [candidate division WOR-3 bacterium]|nr:RDD family protein [candidate division WOR-3 bacterium]